MAARTGNPPRIKSAGKLSLEEAIEGIAIATAQIRPAAIAAIATARDRSQDQPGNGFQIKEKARPDAPAAPENSRVAQAAPFSFLVHSL